MIAFAVSATVWWSRPVDAAAFVDSADNHVACTGTLPPGVTFERDRIAQYLSGPFVSFVDSSAHKLTLEERK